MSSLDWKALGNSRPLGFGDALYVPRPDRSGERLAALLRAGMGPLAVAGAPGCGKSTELAVAAGHLQKEMVACPVPLDRLVDVRRLDAEEALRHIAGQLASVALSLKRIKLSSEVLSSLVGAGVINPKYSAEPPLHVTESGLDVLRATVREVRRVGRRGAVALLVDGLEKCADETAHKVVQALLTLREELALAVVVPPALITGPESFELVSSMRLFPMYAIAVQKLPGVAWQESWEFLRKIALKRMDLESAPMNLVGVLHAAVVRSGGVPRVFLQLLHDAAGYATLHERDVPNGDDIANAVKDNAAALGRLMREGDLDALRAASGTSGLNVPLDRRLRFLNHGLLLEYELGGQVVVYPTPLLEKLLA